MSANEETDRRLDADSINGIDDVKYWARNHEARTRLKFDQLEKSISELVENDKINKERISRNLKIILISFVGLGISLIIITLLSGIIHIF